MAIRLYVAYSRARLMAAVKVKVADSHQQSKRGEKATTKNNSTKFLFSGNYSSKHKAL